jgi:hypothetical protein
VLSLEFKDCAYAKGKIDIVYPSFKLPQAPFTDFPTWTNSCSFEVRSQPPFWDMVITPDDNHYKNSSHGEVFGDGEQTICVEYNDQISPESNLNTATIKLFSGNRPLTDAAPLVQHLWLAFFSRNTFKDKQSPIEDVGIMGGPCFFSEFVIHSNACSPQTVKWGGKLPSESRGTFQWLSDSGSLKFGELDCAKAAQLLTGKIISHLYVTEAGSITETPRTLRHIEGRQLVFDYRLNDIQGAAPITYDTHDGVLRSTNNPIVRTTRLNQLQIDKITQPSDKTQFTRSARFILGLLLVLTSFFTIFIFRTNNKNTKK